MYARRGQCFTTTKFICEVQPDEIQIIEDICRPKMDDPEFELDTEDTEPPGNYTFTDGCGNISPAFVDLIVEQFNLYQSTAF